MVLYADEPRMSFEFDRFDEVRVGVDADRLHAGLLEGVDVIVVEFVTVPVPFVNEPRGVCVVEFRGLRNTAWIGSEPHGSALFHDAFLLLH